MLQLQAEPKTCQTLWGSSFEALTGNPLRLFLNLRAQLMAIARGEAWEYHPWLGPRIQRRASKWFLPLKVKSFFLLSGILQTRKRYLTNTFYKIHEILPMKVCSEFNNKDTNLKVLYKSRNCKWHTLIAYLDSLDTTYIFCKNVENLKKKTLLWKNKLLWKKIENPLEHSGIYSIFA
jgi:hypothetical protein